MAAAKNKYGTEISDRILLAHILPPKIPETRDNSQACIHRVLCTYACDNIKNDRQILFSIQEAGGKRN